MRRKLKGMGPALALFFLAPMIGELLSGSAPPAEVFWLWWRVRGASRRQALDAAG